MKKCCVLVVLMAACAAAIPSSAAAGASCRDSSAHFAQCQTLETCYVVGAAIFNESSAQEAVTWSRDCLATHRRYSLRTVSSGRADAFRRARRLRAYQSTFRSLYCLALRRAGQRDRRICEIRRSGNGRRGGGGGRAPDRGADSPSLTG